ncbi:hypothetical protein [Burkholderia cepacia]|uniref:hypothetical protein n=1 Tax=Burkholderia cepacia TaxID=292 RepID=UPI0012D89B61|nr:hypothetical protein [Burkholderia cepacia]
MRVSVALKTRLDRFHAFWNDAIDVSLNQDPAFFDRHLFMAEVAMGSTQLEPKIRHFVLIAGPEMPTCGARLASADPSPERGYRIRSCRIAAS